MSGSDQTDEIVVLEIHSTIVRYGCEQGVECLKNVRGREEEEGALGFWEEEEGGAVNMKFSVCGGLDAPDWVLAHMSTLSKISSGRIKLLAVHIIARLLENVFDYDKVLKLSRDSLGESELKACIAVLHFFIANAAKFDIDGSTLSKELQQLGLPKEHSDSLCKPYLENKESLQAKFLEQSLQVPALKLGGWQVQQGESKSVVMRFTPADQEAGQLNKTKDLQLCLTAEKFHLLLRELKTAKALMDDLS